MSEPITHIDTDDNSS